MRRLLTATLLIGTAMAVVGMVLVLLAKAVAALLRSGLVDFPTP